MKKLLVLAGVTTALGLGSAGAVAQGGYRAPQCDLKTGHFLVNSGVVYIKGASEESDRVKRERMLNDAQRNLLDALRRGQETNPAVWYYLGRYYVMTNDLVGADSAFDRAERGVPDCAEDIKYYRQISWVPTMNMAVDSMRAGAHEGALVLLRQAYAIFPEDNLAPYYMARIYGNQSDLDSALFYFKEVVRVGDADTSRTENYETSMFNVGLIYSMQDMPDSSLVWYQRYRAEIDPDDPQALTGLASALERSGQKERAILLYDSIMMRADQLDALALFKTGESLFLAEQFAKSARAFELGLDKNAYFRPALYNLANAYLAICNDEEIAEPARDSAARSMELAARRLVAVDPLNTESLNLLAAAFQLQSLDDSTLAVLERREAMAFEVSVDMQQAVDGGYTVQGRVVNLKTEPSVVPEVVFEFLDADGNVIATEVLQAATLDPEATTTFSLTGTGEDLVAARYRTGA
jgi:tetratricopeptide (TPR) repeat protein